MITLLILRRVVEDRFRDIINRLLKYLRSQGRTVKTTDLQVYIVYLLRLRQATAHPFLLEPALKKTLRPEDLEEIQSKLAQVGGQTPVIEQIRLWRARNVEEKDKPAEAATSVDQNGFGSSKFGHEINIENHIEMALASKDDSICNICLKEFTSPHIAAVSIARRNSPKELLLTMSQ